MATALRARTYGELDAVLVDLPGGRLSRGERRHSRSRQLARAHPVAAVAVLVAVTLVLLVTAAIVVAGLFAFSGIWVVLAVFLLIRRGGWHGPPHRHHRAYAARRSRRAGWG